MEFPQQIEETLLEKPTVYDVTMDSVIGIKERFEESLINSAASMQNLTNNQITQINDFKDFKNNIMTSSGASILDDTTPSDSGVQLLDSESSELMIESITSQIGFEFDDKSNIGNNINNANLLSDTDSIIPDIPDADDEDVILKQKLSNIIKSDLENSNVIIEQLQQKQNDLNDIMINSTNEDIMTTSNCSTFDSENIVYRRKGKKQATSAKAPKKRVSFHEDILKNTRTDNIHIEHGFITYKNGRKNGIVAGGGRYSWCSEGDGKNNMREQEQLHNANHDNEKNSRRVVYRNACSDVLDYGNADIYDDIDTNHLKYDNSGIFEYKDQKQLNKQRQNEKSVLYKCSCSSSNSSLDSDETSSNDAKNSNTKRNGYEQTKSSSCDCIGMNSTNNNFISENCYFSEPNIDEPLRKSVWSKEKKPKTSCLKKTSRRHTSIIQEHDLSTKMKKFNVHDMNNLIDNSKMIFGSLKSIFSIPLPERGVPEGSEDVQSVYECIPESDSEHRSSPVKIPPTRLKNLSKSLDGGPKANDGNTVGGQKKFIHNVDEQLRRKNEEDLYAPTRQNSNELQQQQEFCAIDKFVTEYSSKDSFSSTSSEAIKFRNKYIINCESTVFEHTGVSYTFEKNQIDDIEQVTASAKATPLAEQPGKGFMELNPLKQTFANIFKTVKESVTSPTSNKNDEFQFFDKIEKIDDKKPPAPKQSVTQANINNERKLSKDGIKEELLQRPNPKGRSISSNSSDKQSEELLQRPNPKGRSVSSNSSDKQSICSDSMNIDNFSEISSLQKSTSSSGQQQHNQVQRTAASPTKVFKNFEKGVTNKNRHLESPMKKLYSTRYSSNSNVRMSPDLFGFGRHDSKNTLLSEEFDDILTITTTDTDKNDSDIVIVDYPENMSGDKTIDMTASTSTISNGSSNYLKPPKSSLINRFLRNVTQKKILESSIRKNNFFVNKLRTENKAFSGNLYVKGAKPKNQELIEDLNAEIAMEIEMSGVGSPRRGELISKSFERNNSNGCLDTEMPDDISRFELGIGEISIDIFNGNCLHILKDEKEILMKVFKLYTGYSREGHMTPVLVFLTDKALYVTDLVRNRLCNKFILKYSELDVILMGPYGNTVLLSNGSRDMQQVLLAGGPYPADGLVANLELCARRGGSTLPAVGQLTLEHLEPLQSFVRENSSISKTDNWVYYAVVNVPAGTLGGETEPLGPNIKGFLMHRHVQENSNNAKETWHAGYFLLKAGVLYMFNDSSQKLPTWAMALAECQGARRAVKTGRPHCFEILLKHELLQLAAPDEYVASEWLQALVQSASGLFEMQEKHKTLGCTLIMTSNHLITLREDFTSPLSCIKSKMIVNEAECTTIKSSPLREIFETNEIESTMSSTVSTPTQNTNRSNSSINSTPSKTSKAPRLSATPGELSKSLSVLQSSHKQIQKTETNSKKMSSFYGKKSGLEVLTCADIKEMTGIRIPSHNESWWCILEFSCQEVRETSDDLVVFFASSSEMQRFLRMLEQLWQIKNNDLFPITILDEDDSLSEQCTKLNMDINRSWEPLLTAALGYPL